MVAEAQAFLEESWSGVIGSSQAAALANRLPSFFVRELHKVWRANAENYQPLRDYFYGSPFAKANIADSEWAQYRSFLRRQEEEAVPEGELPGAEPMGERDVWDVEQG